MAVRGKGLGEGIHGGFCAWTSYVTEGTEALTSFLGGATYYSGNSVH